MRLQVDILGIFRFLSLAQEDSSIPELIEQLQQEFKTTYGLSTQARILRLQNERNEDVSTHSTVGENFTDQSRIFAIPDPGFCDLLKRSPWQIIGVEEQEFEVRLELLRRIFGDEANPAVLRSCLVRAGGQLGKAVAVASYIRPDVLGTSKKLIFVRPRQDK
ncbi:Conserved_hypothetical protein [Hexamita inflata]|uniref:Nucleolar protein Dnt1-like N-terminal domain-containing protein n=1 Tax=Hexamita inflata TaxID=28002 RepID=A0AA86Q802_9EUKA|nr:Conserved hypothetical protein [Hexamita inflata]CAI9947867.1 Conserved hypothetical protein [Hexamita inflata]